MARLLYGVGINDANYVTQVFQELPKVNGKRVRKLTWKCRFYVKWASMLNRCYNFDYKNANKTYSTACVTPEWHYFMAFRAWMEKQDWQGKELDKDLLIRGNKMYGPDTCVFVDKAVNGFILERDKMRGDLPIGVSYDPQRGKFFSCCKDYRTNKTVALGRYNCPEEAHKAWLGFKLEQAYLLAFEQPDPGVANALISRYENYQEV